MEPSIVDIGNKFDDRILEPVKEKIANLMDKTVDEVERDYQILRLHPLTVLVENSYFNDAAPFRIYSIEELNETDGTKIFIGSSLKLSEAHSFHNVDIEIFVESIGSSNDDNIDKLVKTGIIKILRGSNQAVSYTNDDREAIVIIPKNNELLDRNLELSGDNYDEAREWLEENDLIHNDVSQE